MKFGFTFLAFLLVVNFSDSQGWDNYWVMGYQSYNGRPLGGTDINFSQGFPDTNYVNREMEFFRTCAVISDSVGNLLFYTNGFYVANATHDTMMNGSGLNPGTFTSQWPDGLGIAQADIILPDPANNNQYYLFHETCQFVGPFGWQVKDLFCSKIDMTLNGGLGAVTTKNQVVINDTLINGEVTAVKHANGRDWWVVSHRWNSDLYYKLLVTPLGISLADTQHIGVINGIGSSGQVVFSRSGTKFARSNNEVGLEILDFDRCSGLFSNAIHILINDTGVARGIAFSEDGRYLYVSSTKYVYQYDMYVANVDSSKITVATYDGFYDSIPVLRSYFYLAQLAPDNKIYINTSNSTRYLHTIHFPDSAGLSCNVQQHDLQLPSYNASTMPNLPYYRLGALTGSICDSLSPVHFLEPEVMSINIFPNPARSLQYVQCKGFKNLNKIQFSIYNTLGQHLQIPFSILKDEYYEINVSKLPAGVYFIELLSDQEKVVKRIIKQ